MREYLFRGKRIDDGKWVYGYYVKATHHWHNYGIHEDWIAIDTIQNGGWCNVRGKHAVIPETIGEYTGLCDKNGNKIFEGDILQNEPSYVYSREYRNVVVFDEGEFYGEGSCPFLAEEFKYCEVIGNIHDNPELLEVEL